MNAMTFEFQKSDTTGHYVRGWASVASIAGMAVVDGEGDVVDIEELRAGAHAFLATDRDGLENHDGSAIGEIVESVIIDDEFAEMMGMTVSKRGWFIAMLIHDAGVRRRVVKGELRAFSVGGTAVPHEVEAA